MRPLPGRRLYILCQRQRPGRRHGTYAQYLLKNSWLLMPIPDGVSYEHASDGLLRLGPTFGAMDLVGVDRFDTVLITGAGPVGLGGVINARYRGARTLVVEANPYRAAKAMKLGAEKVFDPKHPDVLKQILDATGGAGRGQGDRLLGRSGRASVVHRRGAAARAGRVRGRDLRLRRHAAVRQPGHGPQRPDAQGQLALQHRPLRQPDAGHRG